MCRGNTNFFPSHKITPFLGTYSLIRLLLFKTLSLKVTSGLSNGKSGFLCWKREGSSVGVESGFLPVAVAEPRLSGC